MAPPAVDEPAFFSKTRDGVAVATERDRSGHAREPPLTIPTFTPAYYLV